MNEHSPCINVCELDNDTKICKGCGRTSYEIRNWAEYSANQQKFRNQLAKQRLMAYYESLSSD